MSMNNDVKLIIDEIIKNINPYERTIDGLNNFKLNNGRNILISIGKAAWTMAKAVIDTIEIDEGVVITKYGHSKGDLRNVKIFEAGHPIVDENSLKATQYALDITSNLKENDNVILLVSGGGSALFEKPLIGLEELQDINNQLLKSGASINEINTIRKRLSMVKGGKFALHCLPAHIYTVVLSDVLGNDLSSIASGPAAIETNNISAIEIIDKYSLSVSEKTKEYLNIKPIKELNNVSNVIIGSVEQLCEYTKKTCEKLGYESRIIKNNETNEAKYVGEELASYALNNNGKKAYIIGGETVVRVKGKGLGGRNTELALAASKVIKDIKGVCLFSFGSDGTDGPTDAAGGYVDQNTANRIDVDYYLENNDSYNALKQTDGLIITGPTGSNVNDIYVLLINN